MKKTILLVEDDFDTLHPLAELLRIKGYSVVTASEAEKALILARDMRPELIITDIVLPGKSGLHFISNIRGDKTVQATPIIVISGCGPMILVEAESAGANYCLEKPLQIERFWATLDQIFAEAADANREEVADARDDSGRRLATEIDHLVEELRQSSNKDEKEDVLKRLKAHILELQAKKTNCA
jgi:DNA-binding response OmpR family regulator